MAVTSEEARSDLPILKVELSHLIKTNLIESSSLINVKEKYTSIYKSCINKKKWIEKNISR